MNEREREQGNHNCVSVSSYREITLRTVPEPHLFTFDHVADPSASQHDIFKLAGHSVVKNCLAGYNSCIFAYGQTGSGKTHTMLGQMDRDNEGRPSVDRGITPRVFEHLFSQMEKARSQESQGIQYVCTCSFLEIYNETVYDLLQPGSSTLQMREDIKRGVFVADLCEQNVFCVEDVMQLLLKGSQNRHIGETRMNRESSRSHSVFTCVLQSKIVDGNGLQNILTSRLSLVDLAGSEHQKASAVEGERLKEMTQINKSLSVLGRVIMLLVENCQGRPVSHIPYRDSKLTFLLQDSLGGNSKTFMIAAVSPSTKNLAETLTTLRFAQRAKNVRNKAMVNEDSTADVILLQKEVKRLRSQLSDAHSQLESQKRLMDSMPSLACHPLSPSSGHLGTKSPTQQLTFDSPISANSPVLPGQRLRGSGGVSRSRLSVGQSTMLKGAFMREQAAVEEKRKLDGILADTRSLLEAREQQLKGLELKLKFRDERITMLTAQLSSSGEATPSQISAEVRNLQAENRQLQQQVENHPDVMSHALQARQLRLELAELRSWTDLGERHRLLADIQQLRAHILALEASGPPASSPAAASGDAITGMSQHIVDKALLSSRALHAGERLVEQAWDQMKAASSQPPAHQGEVSGLRQQLNEAEGSQEQLKAALQAMQQSMQEERSRATAMEQEAQEQRECAAAARERLAEALQDSQAAAEALAEAHEELRALQEANMDLQQRAGSNDGRDARLEAVEHDLQVASEHNQKLKAELADTQEAYEHWRAQAETLTSRQQSLQEGVLDAQGLQEEVEELREQALQLKGRCRRLEDEKQDSDGEAKALQDQLARTQAAMRAVEEQLAEKVRENEEVYQRMADAAWSQAGEAVDSDLQQLERYQNEVSELESEVESRKQEADALRMELGNLDAALRLARDDSDQKAQDLADVRMQLEHMSAQVAEQDTWRRTQEQTTALVMQKMDEARHSLDRVDREREALRATNRSLQADNSALRSRVQELEQLLPDAHLRQAEEGEEQALRASMDILMVERHNLERKLQKLADDRQEEISGMREQMHDLRQGVDAKTREYAQLQAQLELLRLRRSAGTTNTCSVGSSAVSSSAGGGGGSIAGEREEGRPPHSRYAVPSSPLAAKGGVKLLQPLQPAPPDPADRSLSTSAASSVSAADLALTAPRSAAVPDPAAAGAARKPALQRTAALALGSKAGSKELAAVLQEVIQALAGDAGAMEVGIENGDPNSPPPSPDAVVVKEQPSRSSRPGKNYQLVERLQALVDTL